MCFCCEIANNCDDESVMNRLALYTEEQNRMHMRTSQSSLNREQKQRVQQLFDRKYNPLIAAVRKIVKGA